MNKDANSLLTHLDNEAVYRHECVYDIHIILCAHFQIWVHINKFTFHMIVIFPRVY